MKEFIVFLGIVIVSVKAGSITEEYNGGALQAFSSSSSPFGATHYKGMFDRLYTVETRTLNSSFMEFQITAATAGWVGIILNPVRASLTGGDVLIAGIHDDSGQPYYKDMYGDSSGRLTVDSKQDSDWIFVSGHQTTMNRQTKLVFHRRYKTADPNENEDYAITKEQSVYILAIMGQEDDQYPILVNSHAVGSSQVNFVRDGTGGAGAGGNACGLKGSLAVIIALSSIVVFKTI